MKDDVLKVKAAMGKMSKTTLTVVCSNLDRCEWYRQVMYRFCKEAPAVQQWAAKVHGYTTALLQMEFKDAALKTLEDVSKDLHILKESLRPPLLKKLERSMLEKSVACSQAFLKGQFQTDDSMQAVQRLQPVLHEISILYPLEEAISEQMQALAEYVQNKQGQSKAERLLSVAESFLGHIDMETEAIEELVAILLELRDQCKLVQVGASKLDTDKVDMSRLWLEAVGVWSHASMASPAKIDVCDSKKLLELLRQLPMLFGFGGTMHQTFLSAVGVAVDYEEQFQRLAPSEKSDVETMAARKIVMEKATDVLMTAMTFELSKETMKGLEQVQEPCMKAWKACCDMVEKGQETTMKLVKKLQDKAKCEFDKELETLTSISGGIPGGQWSSLVEKSWNWKTLSQAFIDKKVITVEPKQLSSSIETCCKACTNMISVVPFFNGPQKKTS